MPEYRDGMLVSKLYPMVEKPPTVKGPPTPRYPKGRTRHQREPGLSPQTHMVMEVLLSKYSMRKIPYSEFKKIIAQLNIHKIGVASIGRGLQNKGIIRIIREDDGHPRFIEVLK